MNLKNSESYLVVLTFSLAFNTIAILVYCVISIPFNIINANYSIFKVFNTKLSFFINLFLRIYNIISIPLRIKNNGEI